MIEFMIGTEHHASNWGKYFVKGLETWEVEEDHIHNRADNHHNYKFYMADAPVGTVFTIFFQDGNKYGTETWTFQICVVEQDAEHDDQSTYGQGFCTGNYTVIASASGTIRSPRLMTWWNDRPSGIDPLTWANHCAAHINTRGLKTLPPLQGSNQ